MNPLGFSESNPLEPPCVISNPFGKGLLVDADFLSARQQAGRAAEVVVGNYTRRCLREVGAKVPGLIIGDWAEDRVKVCEECHEVSRVDAGDVSIGRLLSH